MPSDHSHHHADDHTRSTLRELFAVALKAASAERCLPSRLPSAVAGKTLIVAVGKAAADMANVAARHIGERVECIVLTRHGHALPPSELVIPMTVIEAGHPLPDEHGIAAAQRILEAVSALGVDDQLLMLMSGGASALLAMPTPGLSLQDKQALTRELLHCGASITEINQVRTHLSAIKGGRLALAAAPARVVTLVASDVPGDDPAIVGSGPTVAQTGTLADARAVLERYGIEASASIRAALQDSANEVPATDSPGLRDALTRVVTRSHSALQAAGQLASAAGYTPIYLGSDIEGESSEVATVHAALALHYAQKSGRHALISGGETTVVVRNSNGRGGRNTEYALALALALDGAPGISAIACDTDGIDGTEDNAGAIVDSSTLMRGQRAGLSAAQLLDQNDSYAYFDALGDLVKTGPTRINVNDFRVILIDA